MKKSVIRLAAILASVVAVGVGVWDWWRISRRATDAAIVAKSPAGPTLASAAKVVPAARPAPAPGSDPAAAKAARIKAILRDYDDIQARMSADYGSAGQSFPGGLNAFLRELALLEREKRADLAKVMTPRELEDYAIGESAAGQKMRAALDGTAATDEQRRAVFRAEQGFNDQFGFTFDLSPPALAVREAARQATENQIRAALGDTLFAAWLQRDDPGYGHFVELAQQQNLPGSVALALWQAKNGFTLSALDIASAPPESVGQRRAALLDWGREQVAAIAPSISLEVVEREVAGWLQQSPPPP
jgi:hypothetical protein